MSKDSIKKRLERISSEFSNVTFLIRKIFNWWVFLLLFIFICLFALYLRLHNLTLLPIFVDEAIYIRWAQVMRAESTLRFLPLSDGKQPLFMWSIIPFFKIFSDPLFAGRFLSVLTGVGTLIGIVALTYLLFKSKKASLVAGFIYAITPFSVFFDRMALVDSMLSMFGIWTLFLAVLTVKKLRLDLAILTGFALGGAYLTKSPALFFTLLLPAIWLLADWKKGLKKNLLLIFKLIFLTAVPVVISQLMYNILRLGPNFHLLNSRNQDYVYPVSHILQNPIDPFIPHLKDVVTWIRYFGPAVLILLLIAGIIFGLKKGLKQTVLILAWFVIPILIQSMYAKVFTARYIYFVIPYLIVLSSLTFFGRSKLLNFITFLLFVIYSITALKQDYFLLINPERMLLPRGERSGYLEEWTAGQGLKESSIYLRNEFNKDPSKKIVVGTEGYFGTLPDGLQIYLNDIPQIIIIGVEVKFTKIPQQLIDSVKSGNKTYLLVNSSRFYIRNPETEGLKLIMSYPKAAKEDGTNESLYFFELINRY